MTTENTADTRRSSHTPGSRRIEVGPLCPKLSEQLTGLGLSDEQLENLDALFDALNLCYVRGLISDSENNRGAKKLLKIVQREVSSANAKVRCEGTSE